MKAEPVLDSSCASTLRNLNAFLDGELPCQAAVVLSQHLSSCPSCRHEAEIRKNMRSRLKSAVSTAQPSPYLATRVMTHVREQGRRPQWLQRRMWAAITAAVAVAFAGGIAYRFYGPTSAGQSQTAYISRLILKVSTAMAPGLADHVHCSVFRTYKKDAPAMEALHKEIGSEYRELLDAVQARVPDGFRAHLAHQCGYAGRKFIHIGLHDGSRQISVILARRQPGESFRDSGLLPVLSSGGLRMYGASAERFQIAGIDTPSHLAYVVSDVSERETRELMLALAPAIQSTVGNLKS